MVVRLRNLAAEVTRVTLEVGSQEKMDGQVWLSFMSQVFLLLTATQANVSDVEGV